MKKNKLLLINELVIKIYDITLECLDQSEKGEVEKVTALLDDREKIIQVIDKLSKDEIVQNNNEILTQLNQVISKIQEKDQVIITNLASLKDKLHFEIAKVFKTKENLKGYNLNKLK
jgi:hypothetical protein